MRSSRGFARWSSIWATKYASIGPKLAMRSSNVDVDALDDRVDEAAEQVAVLGREPEHPRDHADGDVLGVVDRPVDALGVAEPVEQRPAQRRG